MKLTRWSTPLTLPRISDTSAGGCPIVRCVSGAHRACGPLKRTGLSGRRAREVGEAGALVAGVVEVGGVEPGLVGGAQAGPLGVRDGEPVGVAVAAVVDHR